MFEVWFGGGRIENWVKSTYFPPNWKWTNYTAFFSLPTAVAGVGVRIQVFIEIPNKQDIQEVNLPIIFKETSIFYQQHPPTNKKITSLVDILYLPFRSRFSDQRQFESYCPLLSSRGRLSLGYKYHNHFLTFSNPAANKFYKSDNKRNSKFSETGKIIFSTHTIIFPFSLSPALLMLHQRPALSHLIITITAFILIKNFMWFCWNSTPRRTKDIKTSFISISHETATLREKEEN